MTSRNDITGDEIKTKAFSKEGRENYDRIFRKNETTPVHSNSDNPRKGDATRRADKQAGDPDR